MATPDLAPGAAWLAARSPADRRRFGQWSTPWWACDRVAERAVRGLGPTPRVVDPACGDGRFLVAVARHRPDARLVGVDVDPSAVAAAAETCRRAGVTVDLRVADALVDGAVPEADLVIGNPPFVRPQNLPADVRKDLWARFATATNKADLFACFTERALDRAPRVALVLPASFLGLASFRAMRDRLLRAGVDGVFQLPRGLFADVSAPTVALFAGPSDERIAGRLDRDGFVVDGRVHAGPEAWSLGAAPLELPGRPLEEVLALHMGVVCGDYDRYVHAGRIHPEDRPTCRGRDVRRWSIAATDEHVWYVPGDMLVRKPYVAPKSATIYDVPVKIVVAGTTGTEIRAAVDLERRFPLDSCYVGLAAPGVDAWAVLGVLLSRPVADWYGARHRAARVKAVELRRVPIPDLPWDGIAAAARERDDRAVDAAVAEAYARTRV